jgi:hypothetical protein
MAGCEQERRKYGAIGWNIRYEWNQSDLLTAMANLRMYIEEQVRLTPLPRPAQQRSCNDSPFRCIHLGILLGGAGAKEQSEKPY